MSALPPSREPTEAMRETALDVRRRIGTVDAETGADIIARALMDQETAAHARGFAEAREMAAKVNRAWLNAQELRLHAGEMTAQELRTVRAVLIARAAAIAALTPKEPKL